jgi:hypothetical protein
MKPLGPVCELRPGYEEDKLALQSLARVILGKQH